MTQSGSTKRALRIARENRIMKAQRPQLRTKRFPQVKFSMALSNPMMVMPITMTVVPVSMRDLILLDTRHPAIARDGERAETGGRFI